MKRISAILKERKGLSMVETLTALTILALIIFCFAPLFLSYFQTIRISGDTLKDVYAESGRLQKLLSTSTSDNSGSYYADLSAIPLVFNSPQTNVTNSSGTQTVEASSVAVSSQVNTSGMLDPIKGVVINSQPSGFDISAGYSTVKTYSLNSDIRCYPTTLTDDFKTAYITIVANGFEFTENSMDRAGVYDLYYTRATDNNTDSELVKLVFGKDYMLERVDGSNDMLILTLYGGTDVSFENSPIVFNYLNGTYVEEIEVDAPQMIMVGEKATDGNYYYYVSRGEHDENGNLIMLRRTMGSLDAKNNNSYTTLTSAMNDVEWVPAESGDGNNVDSNNEKYGYYVMCGDDGQIRRFWRNNATGNYYWGGDYTYYTDYKMDQVNVSSYINGTPTYSTTVSFYYTFRSHAGDKNYSFKMLGKDDSYLQSANIWSVTAFGKNDNGRVSQFYGSDGKLVFFRHEKGGRLAPLYSEYSSSLFDGYDMNTRMTNGRESQTWLNGHNEGYFEVMGIDRSVTPITLTSVDAMQLSGYSVGAGDGYYTNVADGNNSWYFGKWGTTTNMNYPTQSYTLYCGYIPASMDVWSTDSSMGTSFQDTIATTSNGTKKDITLSKMDRVENNMNATVIYPQWKATLGMSPYLTRRNLITGDYTLENTNIGERVYYKERTWVPAFYHYEYVCYYPYENLDYAITGKFYDSSVNTTEAGVIYPNLMPNLIYSVRNGKQQHMTNGKVVDVTMAYLSHPYAIHISANPSDDTVYDQSNNKSGNKIFYWSNSRETVTFLDSASTVIPNGDSDIPVSLMVGYVMGGLAEMSGDDIYVNTVMNNGIVFLRAGSTEVKQQDTDNSKTSEYSAVDNTGYKLNSESNVFHQFYYLNSRTTKSDGQEPWGGMPGSGIGAHIGDMWGAEYWENNRHINFVSMDGGQPGTGYNYLRCHPMSNTKVNCVAWGGTWNNNPEAMWGTENGTVLSWWVDVTKAANGDASTNWNDRSVDAEIQSYQWIDNVNGRTFDVNSFSWVDTIGSATADSGKQQGSVFNIGNANYKGFYDKTSQQLGLWGTVGVVSTLNSINDVEYDNDMWVAVGDQSGKDPADYCGGGTVTYGDTSVRAYTGNGRGGSWAYVRYWVDVQGTGVHGDNNAYYFWKAVKISNQEFCNIVQINNINGVWIATGYIDANKNGEQDDGEKTIVTWASDPLASIGEEGGWTDATVFLAYNGNGGFDDVSSTVGGINSAATRS